MINLLIANPSLAARMMTTLWYGCDELGNNKDIYILHPLYIQSDISDIEKPDGFKSIPQLNMVHKCVMLDTNFNCTIHNTKPFEGHVINHASTYNNNVPGEDPHFDAVRSWSTKKGRKVLAIWEQMTNTNKEDARNAIKI